MNHKNELLWGPWVTLEAQDHKDYELVFRAFGFGVLGFGHKHKNLTQQVYVTIPYGCFKT